MIPAMPGMRSEVGRQTIKAGPVDMTKSNDQIESGMSTGRGSPLNADKLCIYPIEFLAHAIRAFTAKPGFAAPGRPEERDRIERRPCSEVPIVGHDKPPTVIPAKARIRFGNNSTADQRVPAFAGTTMMGLPAGHCG